MPRQISEERTRKEMIDPQLERAGWYLRAVQSVFLQKRHLETDDLYEPPLDIWRGYGGAMVYGEGSGRSG